MRDGFEEQRDERIDTPMIAVPCGRCVECRRRRRSEWRTRLIHELELGPHTTCWFVTLTFSDRYYKDFKDCPERAIRLFLERWRKRFGKSLRHFFVTELGDNTKRLHFHGLVFDARCDFNYLREAWKYGYCWIEEARSAAACSYVVKYITKDDSDEYTSIILASPGIGKYYALSRKSYRFHHSLPAGVFYIPFDTYNAALPRYYRDKLFTENEIRKHRIELYENPPDSKSLLGVKYFDELFYQRAVLNYYEDSLRRGTSLRKRWPRDNRDLLVTDPANEFAVFLRPQTQQLTLDYGIA